MGHCLAIPEKATTRSSAVERPAIVLDAETRAKRAELIGPGNSGVGAASFSPDCTRIVTTGRGQLHLWETATGAHLAAFAGRVDDPGWCAYSADGTRVLTRSTGTHDTREIERSELTLWDVTATRAVRTLAAPCNKDGFGTDLTSFTPDGALVIARTANQRLCVWDAETGDERAVISLPRGAEIQNCLLSPDGAHVVVFVVRWPADRRVERAERIAQSWSVATGDLQAQWSANDYNDVCKPGRTLEPTTRSVVPRRRMERIIAGRGPWLHRATARQERPRAEHLDRVRRAGRHDGRHLAGCQIGGAWVPPFGSRPGRARRDRPCRPRPGGAGWPGCAGVAPGTGATTRPCGARIAILALCSALHAAGLRSSPRPTARCLICFAPTLLAGSTPAA